MIDWFTTLAQLINFLILVFLLRYFLYDKIVSAMNERQNEVEKCWDDAHRRLDEAGKERESARQKVRQLDDQREQLLAKVGEEVELHRQQLTAKVRGEVDELRDRWSDAIQEETESFLRDLRRRASDEVCVIARRALADLASASMERQIVEHFLQHLERLADGEREAIVASIEESNHVLVVQTTFELPDDLRHAISTTLRTKFFADLDIQFEQSDDLLCGIALQTDAHKLAWNLRDYLLSLEQALRKTLDEESVSRKSRQTEAVGVGR
jgi:F-type H+-transporting ATPase subunit b